MPTRAPSPWATMAGSLVSNGSVTTPFTGVTEGPCGPCMDIQPNQMSAFVTPMLSLTFAVNVAVPRIHAFGAGLVIRTDGAELSIVTATVPLSDAPAAGEVTVVLGPVWSTPTFSYAPMSGAVPRYSKGSGG